MEPDRPQYPGRRTGKRWFMDQRIGRIASDGNWQCAHCPNIYQYRSSNFIEAHLKVEHGIGLGQADDLDCVVIEGYLVCLSGTPLLTPPKWYLDVQFGEELDDGDGDGYWQCAMCTQAVVLGNVETPRRIKWHLWAVHHIYGLEDPAWDPEHHARSLGTEVVAEPVVEDPRSPGTIPVVTAPLGWQRDVSLGMEFTDKHGIWWWSCAACPQTFMRDTNQIHRITDHLEKQHQISGPVTSFIGMPERNERSFAQECASDCQRSATATADPGAPVVPQPNPNWMNHYTVGNLLVDQSGAATWQCAWCTFTCPRTHPAEISNHLRRLHEISDIFPTLRSSFTPDMVDPLCRGGLADLPHGHWVYHPSVGSEYIDDTGGKRWACAWCPKTFARTGAVRMLSHLRDAHGITDIQPMPGTPGGACYPQIPGDSMIPGEAHSQARSSECLLLDPTENAIEQHDVSTAEPPEPSDVPGTPGTENRAKFNSNYYIEPWPSSEIERPSSPWNDFGDRSPTPSGLECDLSGASLPLLNQLGFEQPLMNNKNIWPAAGYDEDTGPTFDLPTSDGSEISGGQSSYDIPLSGQDQQCLPVPDKVQHTANSMYIFNGAPANLPEHAPHLGDDLWRSKGCRMSYRTDTDHSQRPHHWQFERAGNEQSAVHFANGESVPTAHNGQDKQKRVASQQLTPAIVPIADSTFPPVPPPCGSVTKGRLAQPGQSWVFDPRLGIYYRDEKGDGRWRCAICSHNLKSRHHPPIIAHLQRQHNVGHSIDFHAPGCSCFKTAPEATTKKLKVKQKGKPWGHDPGLGSEYKDRTGKQFWRCHRCLKSFRIWGNNSMLKHLREAHDIHDKPRLEDELGQRGPTTDGAWIFHSSVGGVVYNGDGPMQWRCAWCPATMLASYKAKIMYHLRRTHDVEEIIPGLATNHALADSSRDLPDVVASADVRAAGQETLSAVNPKEGGRRKHGWVVHPTVGSEVVNQEGVRIWRCAWCPRAIAYKSGSQIVRHLASTHNIDDINPSSGGGLHPGGFPHDLLTRATGDEAVSAPSKVIARPLGEYRLIAPNPGQTSDRSQCEDAQLGPMDQEVHNW